MHLSQQRIGKGDQLFAVTGDGQIAECDITAPCGQIRKQTVPGCRDQHELGLAHLSAMAFYQMLVELGDQLHRAATLHTLVDEIACLGEGDQDTDITALDQVIEVAMEGVAQLVFQNFFKVRAHGVGRGAVQANDRRDQQRQGKT